MDFTQYTLMHKNIPTIDILINDNFGYIEKTGPVLSAEHLPIGIPCKDNMVNEYELNSWWSGRSIPASREGINQLLYAMNIINTKNLLTRCMGLSLSDQYWIKPAGSDIEWSEVNFFENPFSEDMGNLLFGEIKSDPSLNLCSPDNTSDGCLKKRWKIFDDKRCLVKSGTEPYHQQVFNEIIASKIMDRLDIQHVPYSLIWQKENPYSVCEDFITPETELISANQVIKSQTKPNNFNQYMHYVNLCEEHGIKDIKHSLDEMLVLDYIIANEDRHLNNFGVIRNADTLEWIGAAPIFDSGTSLGYSKRVNRIATVEECKPFKKTHTEQLKLITSFDWIDFSKLNGIDDEISAFLSDEKIEPYIDENRRNAISAYVSERIGRLERFALARAKSVTVSTDASKMNKRCAKCEAVLPNIAPPEQPTDCFKK